ncbi:MAG: PD40 domain-containing protein [Flavobacteriales bacterium]|nr:PD40 domain-containing protein [Flavobacteriales bacterium]
MKTPHILIIFLLFLSISVRAQDTIYEKTFKNKMLEMSGGKSHLLMGNEAFRLGDYKGAIAHYKDVLEFSTENDKVYFKMAQCNLELKRYKKCLDDLNKVGDKSDVKLHNFPFVLGNALLGTGNVDKALESYLTFESSLIGRASTDFELIRVQRYIANCRRAQTYIDNPVDVTITNLGEEVNSEFDDYSPSVSLDGKTMILTSRRNDTKGGMIHPGDGKYFEDVYISTYNESSETWSESTPIPGKINTSGFDASLCIAPDGQTIYLYVNIKGLTGSGDIWSSKLSSKGKWSSPKPLDEKKVWEVKKEIVNSDYFESSATVTADGNMMYFVSERPGGEGNGDVYFVERDEEGVWGAPENLGDVINTELDEISVYVTPDGRTLFFSSKGHDNMGGLDIFVSKMVGGIWAEPKSLGYPINTVKDDLHFSLAADGKKAYYSSEVEGGNGGRDIYQIDLSNHPLFK